MGRLIVLEGTDGSGKSTQFAKLCERLDREGKPFRKIIFPRYDKPSSALIRMYLSGEFGSHPEDVNPYAASTFFAVDRYASWKDDWGDYYRQGGLVLSDRYTTSNAVHQGGKAPEGERKAFFEWLSQFEYGRMGLPEPDLVLWLDMPIDKAVANLRRREADTHTQGDIHEVDIDYLRRCRDCAREAAQVLSWQRVPCVDGDRLRSIEEIHEEIWSLVAPILE